MLGLGCGTKFLTLIISAALEDIQVVFCVCKGSHFWVVSASGNASQPQPLHMRWPGLPAGIDACAYSPFSHSFYFFKGQ